MNITILGCGYVGTALAKLWQNTGHNLTLTTTTPEKITSLQQISPQVKLVKGSDFDAIVSALENQEVVVLSVGARSLNSYRQTYLETAQNLVLAAQKVKTLKQIIYTSSYSVYGNHNGQWVDEETPLKTGNENGQILAQTEQALIEAGSENLAVCILRLGGIYGPGREIEKIFSSAFGKTRPGTGKDITNWIHLDDIVGAIEYARKNRLNGIYNLVNDAYLTSQELLDGLSQRHGLPNVSWDASVESLRSYNARVANSKIKAAGYQLIHPQTLS
ncbi:SDR family oxidoreductase [Ancylothrix sp. C2]|uniref:SDR family oxidoreductase n=1 Tax=Ancylothrix sp. D3o TaxID=2953691 RepID=UPI0021BB97C3|nr:SDR family oxidoreductase [Ancylothrix sp. D3o]MCT7949505.1 SDR family oxidoreductase [Ancylothrix sp. D3o]